MTFINQENRVRHRIGTHLSLWLALAAGIIFFLMVGANSYRNTLLLSRNSKAISHTYEVMLLLENILSLLKDAETGQRGYLITGSEPYLAPYQTALSRLPGQIDDLEFRTSDNPIQQVQIPALREAVDSKLQEIGETIALRKANDVEGARALVQTDRGRSIMESIRAQLKTMRTEELRLREERQNEMQNAYRTALITGLITALLGMVLTGVTIFQVRKTMIARAEEQWLLQRQSELNVALSGDPTLGTLGERLLKFLCEHLNAQAGAFFSREEGHYQRNATYGVGSASRMLERFQPGEGLLGQAVKDRRTLLLADVPEGYLTSSSAFGEGNPRQLLIAPFQSDEVANSVIELGFFSPPSPLASRLLNKIAESVGASVRSASYRSYLHNLLEETQRQAEELLAQGEELRVSNEELEEQSMALRDAQRQLENTNIQLEEHTQVLEGQKNALARAQGELEQRAQELDRASQYKSEFLANMSHELRTPLNSALILAKLLADNPQGNLTPEQIQFAENIRSAGNDLLNLINDILDLSKIEAGHMDVRTETVWLSRLIDDLNRTFLPIAEQKSLQLSLKILPDCPQTLETDRQRLEQVLRNLLSNALKFTERGEVELTIQRVPEARLEFAVKDSGIGIPEEQQKRVFEAFHQVEATSNRKYGGTGLGLSISRELARILGGTIQLSSTPGTGSVFRLVIPEALVARSTRENLTAIRPETRRLPAALAAPSTPRPKVEKESSTPRIQDDRDELNGRQHVLLVIEDDQIFGRILYDLAHELKFQCLLAMSAEDGIAIAMKYIPSAVVLDIGLPDHSGLTVLDRLKQDRRTRHIPVHVISANDYSHSALTMGAAGYMVKPVKREELAQALEHIEVQLEKQIRRVLIVEDDPIQRDGLQRLIGSELVETIGASNAGECLAHLKESTFDCMVLDLSLPDASGYALLEKLSQEDAYSFPPVIVYTGRELSVEEEQQLRRYSQSIIIKGAKSPERLLDEVTLFLHQMVDTLPVEQQRMLELAQNRHAFFEGRRILIVEDDIRNVFALTSILEPQGAKILLARNGREALNVLNKALQGEGPCAELVLMDVMMPEMDGLTATREIRKIDKLRSLPIIMLTAKAMKDDQEQAISAGANDYMAKPLDVEKLVSLIRVWLPK